MKNLNIAQAAVDQTGSVWLAQRTPENRRAYVAALAQLDELTGWTDRYNHLYPSNIEARTLGKVQRLQQGSHDRILWSVSQALLERDQEAQPLNGRGGALTDPQRLIK